MKIRNDYGEGGAGVGSTKTAQHPRIAEVVQGLVTDIGSRTPATIASPDGVAAAGAAPDKAEYDAVVLLVNEIKAAMNAASAATVQVENE